MNHRCRTVQSRPPDGGGIIGHQRQERDFEEVSEGHGNLECMAPVACKTTTGMKIKDRLLA